MKNLAIHGECAVAAVADCITVAQEVDQKEKSESSEDLLRIRSEVNPSCMQMRLIRPMLCDKIYLPRTVLLPKWPGHCRGRAGGESDGEELI